MDSIVFGGGCFWCVEATMKMLQGVKDVESGYAGGDVDNPTYEQVCSGTTGHAEVVRVSFDGQIISLDQLLDVFLTTHDPTQLNRQGNDVGTQYRSCIFPAPDQVEAAEGAIARAGEHYDAPVVTTVESGTYWPGEPYHQDYLANNPQVPYCQAVVAPKVAKARQKWAHLIA